MSTRQYVGARYVPVFANPIEWDRKRSYEHLTIVTYNGNSYTSKKPVPKNVDIGNEEYWVMTANYSAQVEAYRKMVEPTINIKKRKFLIIGDSYNDQSRSQYATNGVTVWGIQAMRMLGVESYTNVGESGAGWYHKSDNGKTFIDVLKEQNPNVDYTDIIVGGGLNDVIHTPLKTELRSPMPEIGDFISTAKSMYGDNVRIHIGVLGYTLSQSQGIEYDYVNIIQSNIEGYNFSYITHLEYAIRGAKYLLTDKLHPTQTASTKIANFVAQYLLGGCCDSSEYFESAVTGEGVSMGVFINTHNDTAILKTAEVRIGNFVYETTDTSGTSMVKSVGVIPNYPFVGQAIHTGLRFVCGSGVTCIMKDKDNPSTLFSAYGTIRFEPISTFDSAGKAENTELYMTLSLYDGRTNTYLGSGHTVAQIRTPFMTGYTSSLAI